MWGIDWPLPLPVDKPKATVSLFEADAEMHAEIESYIKNMLKRYRDILKDRPRRQKGGGLGVRDDADRDGASRSGRDDHEADVDEDSDTDMSEDDDET